MTERVKFVADLEHGLSMTDACIAHGISRKTGYKWLERFRHCGPAALVNQSRRPHNSPGRLSGALADKLLAIREKHPGWGPKKLRAILLREEPGLQVPAQSTIGELLKREGLTVPRRRRRCSPGGIGAPCGTVPNQVWCADYKGQFRLLNGVECYPLTITDEASRYLLGCDGLRGTHVRTAKAVFERVFRNYGLPLAIKTDNGVPFAGTGFGAGGLSRLSVWWLKLGIWPIRIAKGKPQQNGRHERMHRTLKAATARPARRNMAAQQHAFNEFRQQFNEARPHEGIGQKCPGDVYEPSIRELPRKLEDPEYPKYFETRRICQGGKLSFRRQEVFVSETLANELIGLEELEEDIWKLDYAGWPLAVLDLRRKQLTKVGTMKGSHKTRTYDR